MERQISVNQVEDQEDFAVSSGFVKLPRNFISHAIFKKPNACQFFLYCLLRASYKKRDVCFDNIWITLDIGQFVFGTKSVAEELGSTREKIRTLCKNFVKLGILTIRTTNRYSIGTVTNWETYQSGIFPCTHVNNQVVTKSPPSDNHIQEGKERKERKEKKEKTYAPEIVSFVTAFQEYATKTYGKKAPSVTASKTRSDCDSLDKLIRLDGFELDYIKEVLRWAAKDDFWACQILSISGLRKKKDGLTKFQKVVISKDQDDKATKKRGKKSYSKEFEDNLLKRLMEEEENERKHQHDS